MPKTTKLTKHGLNVKEFADSWERQKAQLEAIALESVKADTEVVEAKRALDAAQKRFDQAIKRKTIADERLAAVRANLGGE